jgi:PTS system nitrogen regulatory IIA component
MRGGLDNDRGRMPESRNLNIMAWFELDKQAVLISARVADKQQALELAAEQFGHCYGLDTDKVLSCLLEREQLGSTGFGRRVAIPHGKIEGLEHSVAVLLRLGKPIDFGSIDNLPVDLVIALISPIATGAMHLQALAHISRLTRDEKTLAKIKGADDPDAIFALVTAELDRDAA